MSALPEEPVAVSDVPPSEGAEPMALSVGDELRAAREAAGQTSADVAKTLKLSARQIEALEKGDWSALPGSTFVRGFVRNYARLFRLDADRLVSALEGSHLPQAPKLDLPSTTSESLPESNAPHRRDFAAVLSGVVMVALAVAAYFFLPQNFWQSTQADFSAAKQALERFLARPSDERSAESPAAAMPPALASVPDAQAVVRAEKATQEVAGAVVPASSAVATPLPANSPAATPVTLPAPAPAPVLASPPAAPPKAPMQVGEVPALLGESGVHLSFSRPSWVEIRDRKGQIIFSQLNPADSQRYIEGELPLSLVIGNARYVSLKFRGKPIDLVQRSKDDVARLTLE